MSYSQYWGGPPMKRFWRYPRPYRGRRDCFTRWFPVPYYENYVNNWSPYEIPQYDFDYTQRFHHSRGFQYNNDPNMNRRGGLIYPIERHHHPNVESELDKQDASSISSVVDSVNSMDVSFMYQGNPSLVQSCESSQHLPVSTFEKPSSENVKYVSVIHYVGLSNPQTRAPPAGKSENQNVSDESFSVDCNNNSNQEAGIAKLHSLQNCSNSVKDTLKGYPWVLSLISGGFGTHFQGAFSKRPQKMHQVKLISAVSFDAYTFLCVLNTKKLKIHTNVNVFNAFPSKIFLPSETYFFSVILYAHINDFPVEYKTYQSIGCAILNWASIPMENRRVAFDFKLKRGLLSVSNEFKIDLLNISIQLKPHLWNVLAVLPRIKINEDNNQITINQSFCLNELLKRIVFVDLGFTVSRKLANSMSIVHVRKDNYPYLGKPRAVKRTIHEFDENKDDDTYPGSSKILKTYHYETQLSKKSDDHTGLNFIEVKEDKYLSGTNIGLCFAKPVSNKSIQLAEENVGLNYLKPFKECIKSTVAEENSHSMSKHGVFEMKTALSWLDQEQKVEQYSVECVEKNNISKLLFTKFPELDESCEVKIQNSQLVEGPEPKLNQDNNQITMSENNVQSQTFTLLEKEKKKFENRFENVGQEPVEPIFEKWVMEEFSFPEDGLDGESFSGLLDTSYVLSTNGTDAAQDSENYGNPMLADDALITCNPVVPTVEGSGNDFNVELSTPTEIVNDTLHCNQFRTTQNEGILLITLKGAKGNIDISETCSDIVCVSKESGIQENCNECIDSDYKSKENLSMISNTTNSYSENLSRDADNLSATIKDVGETTSKKHLLKEKLMDKYLSTVQTCEAEDSNTKFYEAPKNNGKKELKLTEYVHTEDVSHCCQKHADIKSLMMNELNFVQGNETHSGDTRKYNLCDVTLLQSLETKRRGNIYKKLHCDCTQCSTNVSDSYRKTEATGLQDNSTTYHFHSLRLASDASHKMSSQVRIEKCDSQHCKFTSRKRFELNQKQSCNECVDGMYKEISIPSTSHSSLKHICYSCSNKHDTYLQRETVQNSENHSSRGKIAISLEQYMDRVKHFPKECRGTHKWSGSSPFSCQRVCDIESDHGRKNKETIYCQLDNEIKGGPSPMAPHPREHNVKPRRRSESDQGDRRCDFCQAVATKLKLRTYVDPDLYEPLTSSNMTTEDEDALKRIVYESGVHLYDPGKRRPCKDPRLYPSKYFNHAACRISKRSSSAVGFLSAESLEQFTKKRQRSMSHCEMGVRKCMEYLEKRVHSLSPLRKVSFGNENSGAKENEKI